MFFFNTPWKSQETKGHYETLWWNGLSRTFWLFHEISGELKGVVQDFAPKDYYEVSDEAINKWKGYVVNYL